MIIKSFCYIFFYQNYTKLYIYIHILFLNKKMFIILPKAILVRKKNDNFN